MPVEGKFHDSELRLPQYIYGASCDHSIPDYLNECYCSYTNLSFDLAAIFAAYTSYILGDTATAEQKESECMFHLNTGHEIPSLWDAYPSLPQPDSDNLPMSHILHAELVTFPYTKSDLTLRQYPTTDGCPIFVSENGIWDWYYVPSDLLTTEIKAALAESISKYGSELYMDRSLPIHQYPSSQADTTVYFNSDPSSRFPYISQNGLFEWCFTRSNMITESKGDLPAWTLPTRMARSQARRAQSNAKSDTKKKPNGPEFTASEMERYMYPLVGESDDPELAAPLHVDLTAQHIKTEKLVRFFKDNTSDKHFIEIQVNPLIGRENWREWLVSMQLLFQQHGIWEVMTREAKPLPQSHPLIVWYNRMRSCALALIYDNVSDTVRNGDCFQNACVAMDPDAVLEILFSHYSDLEAWPPQVDPNASPHNHHCQK